MEHEGWGRWHRRLGPRVVASRVPGEERSTMDESDEGAVGHLDLQRRMTSWGRRCFLCSSSRLLEERAEEHGGHLGHRTAHHGARREGTQASCRMERPKMIHEGEVAAMKQGAYWAPANPCSIRARANRMEA